MSYFAPKLLVVALLILGGAIAVPLGALKAAKRSRRKYAKIPLGRDLTGAQVAGLLLHREGLRDIAVESGAEPLGERYAAAAGRIVLADDSARGRSVHAAAAAAFLVAKVTLHADGDRDFRNAHGREFALAVCANLLPPALFVGLLVPGEGRSVLFVVTPLLLCLTAGYTLFSLPAERHAARRALVLLDRHGIAGDRTERESLRACLAARAALALAAPLTRCFWFNWAL